MKTCPTLLVTCCLSLMLTARPENAQSAPVEQDSSSRADELSRADGRDELVAQLDAEAKSLGLGSPRIAQLERRQNLTFTADNTVLTRGVKLGYKPGVNNAAIISAALADRSNIHPVILPAGVIEITEPIILPARAGCQLQGVGSSMDIGGATYVLPEHGGPAARQGGPATRLVARFTDPTLPMIQYNGRQGLIRDIAFEAWPTYGDWWPYITDSSNANPIVITSTYQHGLADGDRVTIYGIAGNTNANGSHYAKASGYSATKFALYSDARLTSPRAANGADTTSGKKIALWRPTRPGQAIHVRTYEQTGIATGKLIVTNCSFLDFPVGILFGFGMGGAYQQLATYEGEDFNSSDSSAVTHCRFYYPYSSNQVEQRTCMYFRAVQSVGFDLRSNSLHGDANEFLYFERGGSCDALLHINGGCTNVLRIGEADGQDYRATIIVDGGGRSNLGHHTTLLRIDRPSIGATITLSGKFRPAKGYNTFPPDFLHARICGAAKLTFRDFDGLTPHSIQLLGSAFNNGATRHNRLAWVDMDNCTFYGTDNGADLPTPTSGTNASVAPFLATWRNCQQSFGADGKEIMELRPLTDGSVDSHMGNVTYGP